MPSVTDSSQRHLRAVDLPASLPSEPRTQEPLRRRSLLQLGLAGAGAGTAVSGAGAALAPPSSALAPAAAAPGPASAPTGRVRPDGESPRFTVAVIPDTQYLFDGASLHPEPLAASVEAILARAALDNVVLVAHLGDVVQNGAAEEVAAASPVFDPLTAAGMPWTVLAGNHDVDPSTDDQRGPTPWLAAFGPSRFAGAPGYSSGPGGYDSARLVRAGGYDLLVLALDWRVSDAGLAWAQQTIDAHPRSPVLLTVHELVSADDPGVPAVLSDFGRGVFDRLVAGNDQVFLTLNGHFWPPGRTTATNAAGNAVEMHVTNYQDRYYGGAGMVRLYRFDLERSTIDVETINPYFEDMAHEEVDGLGRREVELTTDADRFSVPLVAAQRFAGFAPTPPRPARTPGQVRVEGTVGLWGWLDPAADGEPLAGALPDRSGRGNDLTPAGSPRAEPGALSVSADHHPDSPSRASLRFTGGDATGDHLTTAAGAPLNATRALPGFTVEVFVKLPAGWDAPWSSVLSRAGSAGEAGKTGGYSTTEPVALLSISNQVEMQWQVYPVDLDTSVTSWSHLLPLDVWAHVAITNDGETTRMYVEGSEVVRNPTTPAHGITSLGLPWLLGAHVDGGTVGGVHVGWIGDVRIVDRALAPGEFLNAR